MGGVIEVAGEGCGLGWLLTSTSISTVATSPVTEAMRTATTRPATMLRTSVWMVGTGVGAWVGVGDGATVGVRRARASW